MAFRKNSFIQVVLWGAVLVLGFAPLMISAQENETATEPEPNPNPTQRLITPRNHQSGQQQLSDEWECFDWACEQTEWDPYEAYAKLADEGYTVALTPDELEEGLICLAYDGAVTGSVAGDILGDADKGAEIGAAIAIASGLIRSDYLNQSDDPETKRVITAFERSLRNWDRKFAACLRPKGYRVSSSDY
jgi:hypothetical protein